ncbi:hypothetical protein SBF1_50035 [Candidatus Desulfosporosinus infrequens]|uniref:Uncharacterized protein n=1 Tax=Candidatus Desulfosporosinus infrequens TaxID=2043169 RepID=A0A2U3LGR2_9FIRM|nr:hypothetical protein SBF1_50035 [Candidatus Desulfosporosinus infrequens]
MKRLDIFKSEGGYRLALGIYNDSPVIDKSPWFETKEEAEKARREVIEEDEREAKIEQYIQDGNIEALENMDK